MQEIDTYQFNPRHKPSKALSQYFLCIQSNKVIAKIKMRQQSKVI